MEKNLMDNEFTSTRIENWEANAIHWASYVDCCHLRTILFKSIISGLRDQYWNHQRPRSILDLGCGEGAFLRAFHTDFPSTRLVGLDFCNGMIVLAEHRSRFIPSSFVHGDFESGHLPLNERFDLVTSILSIIEASDLSNSFRNIASALVPNGVCAIAILDPVNDIYRYFKDKRSNKKLSTRNHRILISAHFHASNGDSPKPYFRFVRPLDEYIEYAYSNGLRLDTIYGINSETCEVPIDLRARVVILFFRQGGSEGTRGL